MFRWKWLGDMTYEQRKRWEILQYLKGKLTRDVEY